MAGGVMKRFFVCGKESRTYLARVVTISALFGALCAGCTRAELEDKAGAYNQAIGESNNRQILANAVRASQRGPMSFVGYGDMVAQPTFSGGSTGMWNFDPLGRVTSSVLGTSVNATGGFTTFTLNNLNTSEFIGNMQKNVDGKIVQHFINLNYPPELVALVFVQQYELPHAQYDAIVHAVGIKCTAPLGLHFQRQLCEQIAKDREASREHGCPQDEPRATITIPNSGRHFCSMNRFQTFVRELILLNLNYKIPLRYVVWRTAEGMLYWLGELIAAQNYSTDPYVPVTFANTHTPLGYKLVPLLEVWRGPPLLPPAVAIVHQGELFYIPRPAFGTIDEARSLELLDLVWYAIALATDKDFLPKSTTLTLTQTK
jgi:hypothetical protein